MLGPLLGSRPNSMIVEWAVARLGPVTLMTTAKLHCIRNSSARYALFDLGDDSIASLEVEVDGWTDFPHGVFCEQRAE